MNSVLLDINVLLDVFLARTPWLADSTAVLKLNESRRVQGYVCATAIPTIYYIVRRNADLHKARLVVDECLKSFAIAEVGRDQLDLAFTLSGSDFEDNLATACAIYARLDAIVTRDATGFSASTIPVLSPAELLAKLAP